MKFLKINPEDNSVKENYHFMISAIAPRPIALVGSRDKKNNFNLAPFSFFNAFGANPPIVGFSPTLSGRTGLPKDTLINISETKEFTISIVNSLMVEQTSLASSEYDSSIDEFVKAGFSKYSSEKINVPGVEESSFIMECKLHKIIPLGEKPASGNLILGEIVCFHIDNNILSEDNKIDLYKIDQVGRAGGNYYSEIKKSLFTLEKPAGIGVGFDKIPSAFLNSKLMGNELAKLASSINIPMIKENQKFNVALPLAVDFVRLFLSENKVSDAWQVILNWNKNNE